MGKTSVMVCGHGSATATRSAIRARRCRSRHGCPINDVENLSRIRPPMIRDGPRCAERRAAPSASCLPQLFARYPHVKNDLPWS